MRKLLVRTIAPAILAMPVFVLCVTDLWAKPGATYEKFYADSSDCARRARVILPPRLGVVTDQQGGVATYRGAEVDVSKDHYRDCMFSRGYQRNDPKGWHGYHD